MLSYLRYLTLGELGKADTPFLIGAMIAGLSVRIQVVRIWPEFRISAFRVKKIKNTLSLSKNEDFLHGLIF